MFRRKYFLCLLLTACVFILLTGLCWKQPATRSSMIFPANAILDMTKTANSRTRTEEILVSKLKELSKDLLETQRAVVSSAYSYTRLAKHLDKTLEMLKILNEDFPTKNYSSTTSKKVVNTEVVKGEVCPEKFMGTKLDYGHPFFRKGFDPVPCKNFIPIEELVTILVTMPEELPKPAQTYLEVMQGVAKYFPKIRVILATQKEVPAAVKDSISKLNIAFENDIIGDAKPGVLWQRLVDKVSTRYVLLAPNLTHFDDDINLQRMVRVLSYEPVVAFVAGAHRNLTGHWDIGCQQVSFKNMTATYMGGYYRSFNECLVCDFVSGPFMTKTETLKKFKIDTSLGEGVFRDLFWRLRKEMPEKIIAACPDVMFNTNPRDLEDVEYVLFANKHLIHRIVETSGRVRWYGCRHGLPYTKADLCTRGKSLGLSPAEMENLADVIKFFLRACEDAGAFCELYSGTLIGAVKFNGILPWDIDGDVSFVSANFTVINKLQEKVKNAGYTLSVGYGTKIENGRISRGYFTLKTTNWKVDVWGYPDRSSQIDVANARVRTRVLLAGQYVIVPHNPGLFVRNRFGAGTYKHQEHWRRHGHGTSWSFYNPGWFIKCTNPGHSSCLDQYPADGNMQFRGYCPS